MMKKRKTKLPKYVMSRAIVTYNLKEPLSQLSESGDVRSVTFGTLVAYPRGSRAFVKISEIVIIIIII